MSLRRRPLLSLVERTSGCWKWLGYISPQGYGMYCGKKAHRVVFESVRGPIPSGKHIDHLCQNKWCVNPEHLDPVAHGENARRAREADEWRNRIRRFLETGYWESSGAAAKKRWRVAHAA